MSGMADGQAIILRLTLDDPVAGVAYSLQDARSKPVGQVVATAAPLSFDVPVRVAPGPKFLGAFVRREGAERRFVYIAIGVQAGDHASPWSRRVKVDIHALPPALLEKALVGGVLEAPSPGATRTADPHARPRSLWADGGSPRPRLSSARTSPPRPPPGRNCRAGRPA